MYQNTLFKSAKAVNGRIQSATHTACPPRVAKSVSHRQHSLLSGLHTCSTFPKFTSRNGRSERLIPNAGPSPAPAPPLEEEKVQAMQGILNQALGRRTETQQVREALEKEAQTVAQVTASS